MANSTSIRVRFAPSPTGFLHVGGLRTALYNYLFARKNSGVFILRIEDTDRSRYVEGAVENLIQTLRWAGLDYDEGPGKGGDAAPYIQSERLEIYRSHVDQLIAAGRAYRCFCTPERLEKMRREQEQLRLSPKYNRSCKQLTQDEIKDRVEQGLPHVVRMIIPDAESIRFTDLVREEVVFESEQIDDQVLLKSDGYPTYHLANVVDDHLMGITHVIRGEEWLPSTPKHVLLYRYFGWTLPQFAHLPLLLNSDRSKLSKRQGDVAVEDYRSRGYLPEALVNFVSLLGWNPGTEQEIFSLSELIESFSLDRVNKAGAIFNIEKLDWLNFEHLRKMKDADVLRSVRQELARSGFASLSLSDAFLLDVIEAMRPRASFIKDFIDSCRYFYEPPTSYDQEIVTKRWKEETPAHMRSLVEAFSTLTNPTKEEYEAALQKVAEALQIPAGRLIHPLRLAVSGIGGGPGVYDILHILGKEETLRRLHTAIEAINPRSN